MATGEWRRIGLIVPSSNTIVESDFSQSLPPGVTLHSARMFLAETTELAQRRMLGDYLPQAIEDIASLRPHVVVFACTTAGAMLGAGGERDLIRRISERTQAPVVSMNDAVNSCIARYAPRQVAVITPYIDELNNHIRRSLEQRGLSVAHIAGLGITENFTTAEVKPADIVAYAASELAGVEFDLLYVPCANFRAYEARPALEDRFNVPVVTSDSATIEAALAMLGHTMVPA
jgi:maleate isomerase